MRGASKPPASFRRLRRRAEDRLEGTPPGAAGGPHPADLQRLVHELQVHQVELEMQNEELRIAQRELERARDAAQGADRAKSSFLANMSHEIRTPLSGVVGMLRLLQETQLDDTQRRYAELAEASAKHLLHIIDDLLDLSRVEAGKLEFESVPFSPWLVVKEAVRSLAPQAEEKGIGLSCRIEPAIPGLLAGDPFRLRQVLVNLIGNAVKFTGKGEVTVGAEVADEEPGVEPPVPGSRGPTAVRGLEAGDAVRLRFTVRDTGIGIPAEARDRLFLSFAQADRSTARLHGGTGLGLAISKHLVEQMGGSIRVESHEDRGSVFAFTIPFAPARIEPLAPEAAPAVLGEEDAPIPGLVRILVAEDEPANREVAVAFLQKRGWLVTAVSDGKAAVEAVGSAPFDFVLMDVRMPGLDGLEATRLIREREGPRGTRVPIVGLTAHALKGDRERGLEAGMDDYLTKPVEPEMLFAAVERWVGRRPRPRGPEGASDRTAQTLLIASLRGESEEKGRLGRSFLGTISEGPGRIREALAKGDADQIAFWAHRLGGSLSIFGFTTASDVARELEARGSESRLAGADELARRLEAEIERVKALLAGGAGA